MNRKERRSREAQSRVSPPGSTEPELRQMLQGAVGHHREGRIDQAMAAYEAVLEREPRHADALQFMGVAKMQSGHDDEAMDVLRTAHQNYPGNRDLLIAMTTFSRDRGKIDQAIDYDVKKRECIVEADAKKAERNTVSKELGQKKRQGEDISADAARMKEVSNQIKELDQEISRLDQALLEILEQLPNFPHSSVPAGKTDAENVSFFNIDF